MSNHQDIMATVARVRRTMPRNSDVMQVCDYAEKAAVKAIADKAEVKAEPTKSAPTKKVAEAAADRAEAGGGFDKKNYQRDYMRNRRAAKVKTPGAG